MNWVSSSAVCTQFATSWRQSRRAWTNLPTAKSSCVVSAVWIHPSAVVTQFIISCAVELLRLVTSDDIMTPLLKKLSRSIRIHVVKPLCLVYKLSTESVGSRRELVADLCSYICAECYIGYRTLRHQDTLGHFDTDLKTLRHQKRGMRHFDTSAVIEEKPGHFDPGPFRWDTAPPVIRLELRHQFCGAELSRCRSVLWPKCPAPVISWSLQSCKT